VYTHREGRYKTETETNSTEQNDRETSVDDGNEWCQSSGCPSHPPFIISSGIVVGASASERVSESASAMAIGDDREIPSERNALDEGSENGTGIGIASESKRANEGEGGSNSDSPRSNIGDEGIGI
jgi:hypothetical protein